MNTQAIMSACIQLWCKAIHQRAAMQHRWVQKYSSWVLNTYTFIAQKLAIFAEKNTKIASVMSCQRSDLRKTLNYSQSRDSEGIQWIFWIYTDVAPVAYLCELNSLHTNLLTYSYCDPVISFSCKSHNWLACFLHFFPSSGTPSHYSLETPHPLADSSVA